MHRHEPTLTRPQIITMIERLGGWTEHRGKHIRVLDRDRKLVTVLSTTGSLNGRLYLNVRARLKAADLWQPQSKRSRSQTTS